MSNPILDTDNELAEKLLERELGWPRNGNVAMLAECIRSLSRTKKISHENAYQYLVRAVKLAKEQGIEVNHFFFQDGKYTAVRPAPKPISNEIAYRQTCEQCRDTEGFVFVDRYSVRVCQHGV